jgi:membrane protein
MSFRICHRQSFRDASGALNIRKHWMREQRAHGEEGSFAALWRACAQERLVKRYSSTDNEAGGGTLWLLAGGALLALAALTSRRKPSQPANGVNRNTDLVSADVRDAERHRAISEAHVSAPWHLSFESWKEAILATYREISSDRLLAVAGGVVFYGLLAIFPAITAFVSLYGLFADPATVSDHLLMLRNVVPENAYAIFQQQVNHVLESGSARLGFASLIGLAFALWSANAGTKAAMDALNVVYGVQEKRNFFRLNLVSLALTVSAIAVLLIAVIAVVVVPFIFAYGAAGEIAQTSMTYLRWPLLLCVLLLALLAFYRFGPSRRYPGWRWLSVGMAFAVIGWLIGSSLLSWYLANFANYNAVYGSLGTLIGLMIWMWVSTAIVLIGAELNAELEHVAFNNKACPRRHGNADA